LDGLVNNYNKTIIEAICCDMDIKFIGSGAFAKAILYHITDYITKTQLKTHVAYAALELAVKRLGEYNPYEDNLIVRANTMLQKCTYALISPQELSSQPVALYLMDFEDHFTSHTFNPLFWTSFEHQIEVEQPSPECYKNSQLSRFDSDSGDADTYSPKYKVSDIVLEDEIGDVVDSFNNQSDDSEVIISFDNAGKMHASISPVTDYILRGQKLADVNVRVFIAYIKKVNKKSV
jgi:hypothetical protein